MPDKPSTPAKPRPQSLKMSDDPLSVIAMANLDNEVKPDVKTDILTSRQQESNTDKQQDDIPARQPEGQQEIKPAGRQDGQTEVSQASKIAGNPARRTSSQAEGKQNSSPAADPGEDRQADPLDPVDRALLEKLQRPYPDLNKELSTLVSSRLPNDLVARLGVAADLVKKHRKTKQDVITRGLLLAFAELAENNADVDWYER